jgi:hypothetical protein
MREGNSNAVADAVMKRPSVLDASNIKNKASGKSMVMMTYNLRYLNINVDAIKHQQMYRTYICIELIWMKGLLLIAI